MATTELKRLTNNQLRNLKASFDLFDIDGSGVITMDEYMRIMESLGQDIDSLEAEDLFRGSDIDGDADIHFSEFLTFYAKKWGKATPFENEDEQVFDMFDIRNADGRIDKSDLERISEITGAGLTTEEISAIFENGDIDQDGALSLEEFTDLMKQADKVVMEQGTDI